MLKVSENYNTSLATLAVTFGAAIWGIYWWPLRYIEQLGMTGLWTVVLASAVPLVILLPLLVYYQMRSRQGLMTILVIGLFSGSAVTFYSIGLIETTVVRATLLFYLTPVWSTLIGISVLNESVMWNRWAAMVLGLVGLYFIVGGSSSESQPINIGDWFGFASGICWAIGGVLIKRNPQAGVTIMVCWQHLFAFLVALLCCFLITGIEQVPDYSFWIASVPVIAGYSWIGLVPSLFAIFWASSRLFPGRVGILMMTEVIVAVISSAILLDEVMPALEWLGVVMIISAGFLELMGSDQAASVD